jgi:MEMO1 family protein
MRHILGEASTMKRAFCSFFLAALVAAGCQNEPPRGESPKNPAALPAEKFEKVREAAVAGLFYPKDEGDLKREIARFLAEAKPEPVEHLRALVCPHAGYRYSAPVAAYSYKLLAEEHFSTVVLLGPSHCAVFEGAFVSTADAYQTPLGTIPLSPKVMELAKVEPFSAHPPCSVDRPDWAQQSPKYPPSGKDTPETWEYSLEVQLPFLQCTLHNFSIVPVVFGQVNPARVAKGLVSFLDDRTLIVVSTDLSHFHPYEEAKTLDAQCVKAVCDLRADAITDENACGRGPLAALVDIARRRHWKAKLLDYRNSGDTAGNKNQVVGYAAIAFYETDGSSPLPKSEEPQFSLAQRRFLIELARKSVTAAVTDGEAPKEDAEVPAKFRERRACFVTLTRDGELRGCIGGLFPEESLYQAVIRRARSAAIEDSRFLPVQPDELKQIEIEVSVLTVPKPLAFNSPEDLLVKLRPGIDGVVLEAKGRRATYLPQVWRQLPDKRTFLGELAQKAGLAADAWMSPGAAVMTYQVEAFHE